MPNATQPLTNGDPSAPDALRLPSGSVVVIPRCVVTGGKSTISNKVREDEEGNRIEVERNVTTTIEDKEEREQAEKLASAGVYQIRRACHSTPIGYVTHRDNLPEIDQGLTQLRAQVATFNGGSVHSRVSVSYLLIPLLAELGPEEAKAMADTIREGLERTLDAIRSGSARKATNALTGIQNMDQLCTGVQRESVLMALDQVKDAIRHLREETKRGLSEASAGASAPVDMIEAGIGLFSY
jgi:hypothetical protein